MTTYANLPRQPLIPSDDPRFLPLRWMAAKLLHIERLNPQTVGSTYVEFYGHAPMTDLGPRFTSDPVLIQLIRDTARQNNSTCVFVIRPTIVEPDGKRGVFCYLEMSFGETQQTVYKMFDGELWNEVEADKQPLGRLLYAPGEPIPN